MLALEARNTDGLIQTAKTYFRVILSHIFEELDVWFMENRILNGLNIEKDSLIHWKPFLVL
ncbi:hypothetical protein BpJC7_10050 [Weizmannia acidilactici]|uniref:Uncharacterized protein n=1 Tax=Weizmannia acidilactici TaxID=2607726 RepID=A0A5J4J3Y5_9BACI|nr:hypothetical protein BpJC4_16630 [Weizmannia acidilactici]GER69702.1 hypothetical protein BpJC7_10050 [Weizmannia acidilactici]GER72477.1 hypothetical protein BpPP18_05440 [Weizmannia acidilactici]